MLPFIVIMFCGGMPLPIILDCSILVTPSPQRLSQMDSNTVALVYASLIPATSEAGGCLHRAGGSMRWRFAGQSTREKANRGAGVGRQLADRRVVAHNLVCPGNSQFVSRTRHWSVARLRVAANCECARAGRAVKMVPYLVRRA